MFSVRDIKNISHAKPTDTALKPCDIHFHYQNVRGLRTKLTEFGLNTLDAKYQIIILTETWLDNSIPSSLLFDPGYSVYRCDRSLSNSMHTRGGGALIACSFLLNTRELTLLRNSLEQVWVTVRLSSCTIFIGTVYIPPNRANDTNTLTSVIESYHGHHRNKHLVTHHRSRTMWQIHHPRSDPGFWMKLTLAILIKKAGSKTRLTGSST